MDLKYYLIDQNSKLDIVLVSKQEQIIRDLL